MGVSNLTLVYTIKSLTTGAWYITGLSKFSASAPGMCIPVITLDGDNAKTHQPRPLDKVTTGSVSNSHNSIEGGHALYWDVEMRPITLLGNGI